MGKEIDLEIREQAEDLYITQGLTYEQTAGRTGVSVGAIKIWSEADNWRQRRKEYRASLKEIEANAIKLRRKLFNKALDSLDPQDVYAAVRLEKLAQKSAPKQEDRQADIDRPKLFLESLEFIAMVLNEIDPEGLKVFSRNFETIVERFKKEHAQTA